MTDGAERSTTPASLTAERQRHYERGVGVLNERYPLTENEWYPSAPDMVALLGQQAVEIERLRALAAEVVRLFLNDEVVVDETYYTTAFMEAGMALANALDASQPEGASPIADGPPAGTARSALADSGPARPHR